MSDVTVNETESEVKPTTKKKTKAKKKQTKPVESKPEVIAEPEVVVEPEAEAEPEVFAEPEIAVEPEVVSEPVETAGDKWWKETGSKMQRRGHSQRNIILKAAQASGKNWHAAMLAMRAGSTVEAIAISLFD